MIKEDEIKLLVIEELKHCTAPISGILVASAIITEKGFYLGHNTEKENPATFEHAEKMALNKVLEKEKSPKINKIIMAGGGKVDKYKFYTPCYPCSQSLSPYITSDTEIILTPLGEADEGMKIAFNELIESYSQLPYSKISATKEPELITELAQKTVLEDKDINFISDLAQFGILNKVSFYLTGSASGRGGVSTMLNRKSNISYRDIDLIAVITSNFESMEAKIESLIRKHYRTFVKVDKSIPAHHNKKGVVFKKTFYFCGPEKNKLLDFTFSTDLIGTLAKNEYEVKNWFHQLSE